MVSRGDIWWADLPEPVGSEPGYPRPVLVVQANAFNRSAIRTVIVAMITSNLQRAQAPGNVLLRSKSTNLPKDSVVNVSQLVAIDRTMLKEKVGRVSPAIMEQVAGGLRLVLSL